MLITNQDIDHRIDRYNQIYSDLGIISFQMSEEEYRVFQGLTRSYNKAKSQAGFTHESWSEDAKVNGLFKNEKAVFVFGFLVLHWSGETKVSAERKNGFIILTISNRD